MKALSVKAPWAQFMIYGIPLTEVVDLGGGRQSVKLSGKSVFKDIENRDWPLWRYFKPEELPVRVYIHVGQRDDDQIEAILDLTVKKIGLPFMVIMAMMSPLLGRGAIIGEVDITGCVTASESPWFVGKYGFTTANPIAYDKPIPYRGQLGFFEVKLP